MSNEFIRNSVLDLLKRNLMPEGFITPTRLHYKHQWLWDSCFHAIILSQLDSAWAKRELASLIPFQWENGMFPHIRFSDEILDYRPNVHDWKTNHHTSGMTQPPLLAVAAKYIYDNDLDREFLARIYPAIAKYHHWMKTYRDINGTGLGAVVHPWESGMDNSPVYDQNRADCLEVYRGQIKNIPRVDTALTSEAERPKTEDYQYYWGLVESAKSVEWDPAKVVNESRCLIADVAFNSIWVKANDDLAALANILGHREDAACWTNWANITRNATNERLWHSQDQSYYPFDFRRGTPISVPHVATFIPLWAEIPNDQQAKALIKKLQDPRQFAGEHGIPSVPFNSPQFDAQRYWRGPIWINVHWLIANGLERYGEYELAEKIRQQSATLVGKHGFFEYYDAISGEPKGAKDYSWDGLVSSYS